MSRNPGLIEIHPSTSTSFLPCLIGSVYFSRLALRTLRGRVTEVGKALGVAEENVYALSESHGGFLLGRKSLSE